MSPIKVELLKALETAPDSAVAQTLEYLRSILPQRQTSPTEFQPQTALGKQLWEIRQRAIANNMPLLDEAEIEQELIERRGGLRDF
jgi:hypothetical protein